MPPYAFRTASRFAMLGLLIWAAINVEGLFTAPTPAVGHELALRAAGVQGRRASRRGPSRVRGVPALRRYLGSLVRRKEFARTRWGILIESLDRPRVLFEHNRHQLFIPASNTKLYTTATALARLGPDYRARTSIYAMAPIDGGGAVQGDLVCYGRGAVDLHAEPRADEKKGSFALLAEQLWDAGVREVQGDLVADESYFFGPRLGVGWEWDDLQWPDGAEVSALSTDVNVIRISITPGESPSAPATAVVSPANSMVQLTNRVTTSSADRSPGLGLYRGLENNRFELWGTVPMEGPPAQLRAAVHDPALLAGDLLSAAMRARGIILKGKLVRLSASDRQQPVRDATAGRELAYLESASLSDVIRGINKPSQNLQAELLLRTLGRVYRGEGSDRMGLDVVLDFLREIGAPVDSIMLRDGSGLSRQNLITPSTTVALLRHMDQHPYRKFFIDSLPVAGVDGTLKNRMAATRAQQNVRAKTGTLAYTSCLSGYVICRSGERLVFSIMVNDQTAALSAVTGAVDEICAVLANWSR
ncbi:MAG: D-alanyl-D-alanine carboxypeptidase/D-alanyl-D-alanine-endopeptidase [Acidobacteria bacterium]|nr:D-alanyl-D-alanine carboxypeptidase/D-alanyl-D-alanine-endopeptidase [Acidobacteriota bacterium]